MAEEGDAVKAQFYLQKYLTLRPNDYQARLRLIDNAEQLAERDAGRKYLMRLLAETIGLPGQDAEAERPRLRVMLAEQLLLNEQYNGALEQIKTLEDQSRLTPDAKRVKALASLRLIPTRGSLLESTRRTKLGDLLPLLQDASDDAPGDPTLALAIAEVYREYPSLAEGADQLANDRVDRMVAERPNDPDALLTRYRYRKKFHIDGAIDDLRAAHRLDPGHYETNVLFGLESLQDITNLGEDSANSVARAERYFRAAINGKSTSSEAYYLLARLQWGQGERSSAIALLRDANHKVVNGVLEIRFLLADFLISEGEYEEASSLVGGLQKEIESLSARMTASGFALANNRLRLLEARLSAGRGDLTTALAYYSAISNSPEFADKETGNGANAASAINRQAGQETAKLLARLGRWDQVAQQYSLLASQLEAEMVLDGQQPGVDGRLIATDVSLASEHTAARIQAAEAYLRAGQYANAIKQLDATAKQAGGGETALPLQALETRLIAELSVQLDSMPGDRSWEEFEFLANRASKELPSSERVALAILQYHLAGSRSDEAGGDGVRAEVRRVTQQFPSSPRAWWIAVRAYVELGDNAKAEDALGRYLALEQDEEMRISRRVAFLVDAGRVSEAQEWVNGQLAEAGERSKPLLRRLELRLLASAESGQQALSRAKTLARTSGDNKTLALAWQVAIEQEDWKLAEEIEAQLEAASTVARDEVRYYRAQRMLARYEDLSSGEQDELERLVSQIRSDRPNWHFGAEMAGRLADARGNGQEAIQAYELAVALGDRSTSTLERLTLQLFREGRYGEAQGVIDRLRSTSEVLSNSAESLAINTALKQERILDAKNLALASVAKHPEDPARKLWLYHVLLLSGEVAEAEIVLSEAAEKFPDSEILWKAKFAYIANNNRHEEALQLLKELPRSLNQSDLVRSLTLARGYEMLGELTRSRTYYQQALDIGPQNHEARLQYANLLLKSDAMAARQQFEEVVRQNPNNVEARRKLAALLAATGEPAAWERIDELLVGADDPSSQLDKRLRAILLTKRGKTIEERAAYCELARRILLSIVEDSSYAAQDVDRLLLAGAYEQEGVLNGDPTSFESARSQLTYLQSRSGEGSKYNKLYTAFLLRSIEALAKIEDSDAVRTAFISDARMQLAEQERVIAGSGDSENPLTRLSLLGLQAKLLSLEGRSGEATSALQQYADKYVNGEGDDAIRSKILLGLGAVYSSIGAHAEAEPWYRQLMKTAPGAELLVARSLFEQGKSSDAVDLFLGGREGALAPNKAAMLASLLSISSPEPRALEEAWPAVAGALDKHSNDIELLVSVAVLEVTRGNQEQAIRLFRRVLEIDPDHTLSLNNLATLLGERASDQAEALRLVSHAMRVAGRSPALLDTQGTIRLQSGDTDGAVSSLEEAVASVSVDPRYYFHLAAAYWRSGRSQEALDALEKARRRGLDRAVLTSADRQLMQELEAGLGVARITRSNET